MAAAQFSARVAQDCVFEGTGAVCGRAVLWESRGRLGFGGDGSGGRPSSSLGEPRRIGFWTGRERWAAEQFSGRAEEAWGLEGTGAVVGLAVLWVNRGRLGFGVDGGGGRPSSYAEDRRADV